MSLTRRAAGAALISLLTLSAGGIYSPHAVAQQRAEASATHARSPQLTASITKFFGSDSGSLSVFGRNGKQLGKCPLKHTDVKAKISGYVARVTVKQIFANPFKEKIEATYTFPLSETGAVDDMTMKVGTRTIKGTIKKREEARKIYEQARREGKVASVLDQERANIFTQSVANILPGNQVEIIISYVDLLPYEAGSYTFAFPTVVGPRFIPGQPTTRSGRGWSPDTDTVPDASRITPPVAPQGTRTGHDISIDVDIDAGVTIHNVNSRLHDVDITHPAMSKARVTLADKATIPNKDFVLQWQVATDQLRSGYLTHRDGDNGYFTLMILPPKRVTPAAAAPKEMVFLIDCSGSQSGAPLRKAKETMLYILDRMNQRDTFQIITFNNSYEMLFDKPRQASLDMKTRAKQFIKNLEAQGGTWMAPAVEAACAMPADEHRLRIVTFMTDGYVGNDYEILALVKKLRGNSRWFPFGTGNSVNRLLIDGMAKEGGGEAEYVLLNSSGEEVAQKFYNRISSPVLTDIKLDFDGLAVKQVYPSEVADVWAERPLYIKGRYSKPGKGTVTISGFAGGKPYTQKLDVVLPDKQPANEVLGPIWARAKVDRLMSEDWFAVQAGKPDKEIKDEIVEVALEHHIMTNYTSFVAVEERVVNKGGILRTVTVPVEAPDGVDMAHVFGERADSTKVQRYYRSSAGAGRVRSFAGSGGGNTFSAYSAANGLGRTANAPMAQAALPAPPPVSWGAEATGVSSGVSDEVAQEKPALLSLKEPETSKEESDREERQAISAGKLDATLSSLLQAKDKKTPSGLTVGSDGKVMVQLLLKDTGARVLETLKKLGVEILTTDTRFKKVIARVPVTALDGLTKLQVVLKISAPPGN